MISITKLYCGDEALGDALRYGIRSGTGEAYAAPPSAAERRPVTVWNVTRACNLRCIHCYTASDGSRDARELSTEEARAVIRDLADFRIPALLFSGGEPLLRPDLLDLVRYAAELGIRPILSTNGTLITEGVARALGASGIAYVGISLDGIGETNDRFRGVDGAFEAALRGFRSCVDVGQRVGLRLTLTRHNYRDLGAIFDLIEREGVDRACFYHLVYSGRGREISQDDLTYAETRRAMDIILERARDYYERGLRKDILTVDNHVDGVYLYRRLRDERPERAEEVLRLIRWNGGGLYSSGVGIGNIDYVGNVHPDQFWMHYTLGNVRQRRFSDIWTDTTNPIMKGLKARRAHVKGRCALCRWFDACGGSLRVRADIVYGDPWAPDPACYLTDDEIGLTAEDRAALRARGGLFSPPRALTGSSQPWGGGLPDEGDE